MTWEDVITEFLKSEQGQELKKKVAESRAKTKVFPAPNRIFQAYLLTPIEKVNIVIVGTDPYFIGDHADGIAFSSKLSTPPETLKIIFKELRRDLYPHLNDAQWKRFFSKNELSIWSKKGILLINRYLTVEEGKPKSHKDYGWDYFNEKAFKILNEQTRPIVFMFWGNDAKECAKYIDNPIHLKLEGVHPSSDINNKDPKFHGCGHFKEAVEFIKVNRPDISQSITLDINKYFNKDMFKDFSELIKNDSYPFLFKTDEELADALRSSLKLTYDYGFDFTLIN